MTVRHGSGFEGPGWSIPARGPCGKRRTPIFWILVAALALEANPARGQGVAATDGHDLPDQAHSRSKDAGSQGKVDVTKQAMRRFAGDQRDLWTSPIHVRSRDAKYLLLLGDCRRPARR